MNSIRGPVNIFYAYINVHIIQVEILQLVNESFKNVFSKVSF